jgi:hypothetical protein
MGEYTSTYSAIVLFGCGGLALCGVKIKQLLLIGQVIITSREPGFNIQSKLLAQKYSFQTKRIPETLITIITIKTIIILIIICNYSISNQYVSNQCVSNKCVSN